MRFADSADLATNEGAGVPSDLTIHRLESRAFLFEPLTEQLFRQAGLREGMRVLAVDCGSGDLAFLAAQFVGSTGTVVGIDESDAAISTAIERARLTEAGNIRFEQCSVDRFTGSSFDAVVGRFNLMHQPDPVATIWRLASVVCDGGLLAVQEFDFTQAPLVRPEIKLVADAIRWRTAALEALGYNIGMGMRLHQSFLSAGLQRPSMLVGAVVESGAKQSVCNLLADSVRDLLEPICALGIVTADEIGIETLASRLHRATLETDAVIASPLVVSAWKRVARRPTRQLASRSD